ERGDQRMDREHRSCAVCERDNREEAPETHSRDGWILKECPDCSLVYLENPATYETLVSDHAWEKSFFAERASRRRNRRAHYLLSDGYKLIKRVVRGRGHLKLLRVLRAAAPEGRVLDVGCGFGRTLAMLGSSYTPFGVEISAEQAKQADVTATARGGWVVQASATEGVRTFDEGFFDGVIMHAFLEHENAPRELLEGVHRVLKPGAPAIIKVPNWASVNRRLR